MGVHHGLAQLVGGRTGIAARARQRRAAGALDPVQRRRPCPTTSRRIGEAIGDADDAAGAVAALVERLGLPSQLGDCGVTLDDVEAVAQQAPSNRNVAANPRPVTEDDAKGILLAAY